MDESVGKRLEDDGWEGARRGNGEGDVGVGEGGEGDGG